MINAKTKSMGTIRYCRWLSNFNSSLSDRELQESFKGFWPKLLSLRVLFTVAGREHFLSLFERRLVFPSSYGFMSFAFFQNPLLHKYDFDLIEFSIGAKHAYQQHMSALRSTEFENFAKGRRKSSPIADFLRSSTNKSLYNEYLTTLKGGSATALVDFIDPGITRPYYVYTKFIKNDEPPEEVTPLKELLYDLKLIGPREDIAFKYPDESVVAVIFVFFLSLSDNRVMRCEFEGCISGHVPLEWKIKSLRESIIQK